MWTMQTCLTFLPKDNLKWLKSPTKHYRRNVNALQLHWWWQSEKCVSSWHDSDLTAISLLRVLSTLCWDNPARRFSLPSCRWFALLWCLIASVDNICAVKAPWNFFLFKCKSSAIKLFLLFLKRPHSKTKLQANTTTKFEPDLLSLFFTNMAAIFSRLWQQIEIWYVFQV